MRSMVLGCCAVAAVAAATSAVGAAGTATRADFVRQADKMCRADVKRAVPHARRGNKLFRKGKYRQGAKKYLRVDEIFREGMRDVRGVPHPPRDDQRIDRWIQGELKSLTFADRGWRAVGQRSFRRADRHFDKSRKVHRKSHSFVRGFKFKHCA